MDQMYPAPDYGSMDNGCGEAERIYPKCDICGEEIRDEHYFFINEENICSACLNEHFRMKTEDFPQW